jgi:hypothetical protein
MDVGTESEKEEAMVKEEGIGLEWLLLGEY